MALILQKGPDIDIDNLTQAQSLCEINKTSNFKCKQTDVADDLCLRTVVSDATVTIPKF